MIDALLVIGAERDQVFTAPYLVFYPRLAIMLVVLSFNLLVDGLRDGRRRENFQIEV